MRGMELLPTETILQKSKKRCQIEGVVDELDGIFKEISGCRFSGYEIHMGETFDGRTAIAQNVIMSKTNKNVYGSYVHGIFDQLRHIIDGRIIFWCKFHGYLLPAFLFFFDFLSFFLCSTASEISSRLPSGMTVSGMTPNSFCTSSADLTVSSCSMRTI